jgi:hypothetical protein
MDEYRRKAMAAMDYKGREDDDEDDDYMDSYEAAVIKDIKEYSIDELKVIVKVFTDLSKKIGFFLSMEIRNNDDDDVDLNNLIYDVYSNVDTLKLDIDRYIDIIRDYKQTDLRKKDVKANFDNSIEDLKRFALVMKKASNKIKSNVAAYSDDVVKELCLKMDDLCEDASEIYNKMKIIKKK